MIVDHDTISFRQSWLGTAFRCPEEGRLAILHPELELPTDEAVIGTAAHYGIEQYVIGEAQDLASMLRAVDHYYATDPEGELAVVKFTKRSNVEEMRDLSRRCVEAWWTDLRPHFPLEGAKAEVEFEVQVFEYRGYKVVIKGTVDLAPAAPRLGDWKTASSDYKQKAKQKWAIQPTIYGLAAVLGAIRDDVKYTWPIEFDYGVMIKRQRKCRGQIVTVQRTAAHAAWAVKRMKAFIDLYLDYGTDRSWPLIDEDNYLCSQTWCSFYDMCRGKYISSDLDLFGWNPQSK